MFPKCPRILPKVVYYGQICQGILNVPLGNISSALFWLVLSFTGWEHCDRTGGDITKEIVNEPLGNITGGFFGKIQDFPKIFLIGTSWSHDWEHCECTGHFLHWGIAEKLARKILDVLAVYRVGMGWVLYPFPCSVFVMSQPGTLHFVPSESWANA